MNGRSRHEQRNIFSDAEQSNGSGKVRRCRSCPHAGAVANIRRIFVPIDVAANVERDVDASATKVRNSLEQQIETLLRNDLTDEDDATRYRRRLLPLVGSMRNGVVDNS